MLIVLKVGAGEAETRAVAQRSESLGYHASIIGRPGHRAVAVSGGETLPADAAWSGLAGIERVLRDGNPCFLASRLYQPENTTVDVAGVAIGGGRLQILAGPCAVESESQLFAVAEAVQKRGGSILRAGAFKLRTSPWSFQGLGARALDLLAEVKRSTGLRVATEVVSETTLESVAAVADLIQVGARNMKNYELLKRVGECGKPVLLKRGADALLSELLLSAEYLLAGGCPGVVLCERGVRGFGDHARNTLDLAAVPALKRRSHLPVIVDPSHGTGDRMMVLPLALAAVAAGADGLMIEVHPNPSVALSDGPQALRFEDLDPLWSEAEAIHAIVNRPK